MCVNLLFGVQSGFPLFVLFKQHGNCTYFQIGDSQRQVLKTKALFHLVILMFDLILSRVTEEPQSWMGYFGQALKTSANYLPSQVSEMFNQGRDFAIARLPFSGLKNVCTLAKYERTHPITPPFHVLSFPAFRNFRVCWWRVKMDTCTYIT
jgi:hypothetical protein